MADFNTRLVARGLNPYGYYTPGRRARCSNVRVTPLCNSCAYQVGFSRHSGSYINNYILRTNLLATYGETHPSKST